jgi:hypothetical protein
MRAAVRLKFHILTVVHKRAVFIPALFALAGSMIWLVGDALGTVAYFSVFFPSLLIVTEIDNWFPAWGNKHKTLVDALTIISLICFATSIMFGFALSSATLPSMEQVIGVLVRAGTVALPLLLTFEWQGWKSKFQKLVVFVPAPADASNGMLPLFLDEDGVAVATFLKRVGLVKTEKGGFLVRYVGRRVYESRDKAFIFGSERRRWRSQAIIIKQCEGYGA